ncbi:PilW family protein [Thermodesulfobacteriota bacterium]
MTILPVHNHLTKPMSNERGVTLMEAMVYTAIAGMLLLTAVTAFLGQNKSYNRQDVIAEIQQNVRGAAEILGADIRFAGFDHKEHSIDPFVTATTGEIEIEYWTDLDDDGRYDDNVDPALDEITTVNYTLPGGTTNLMRTVNGAQSVIAENIERFRLEYLLDDGSWAGNPTDLNQIRAVKIIFLGSARPAAFNPTDSSTYFPPVEGNPGEGPWTPLANTGYKRMVTIITQCRNCGS